MPCGSGRSNPSHCQKWSGRQDLNLRPPAPKAGALIQAELRPVPFTNTYETAGDLPETLRARDALIQAELRPGRVKECTGKNGVRQPSA